MRVSGEKLSTATKHNARHEKEIKRKEKKKEAAKALRDDKNIIYSNNKNKLLRLHFQNKQEQVCLVSPGRKHWMPNKDAAMLSEQAHHWCHCQQLTNLNKEQATGSQIIKKSASKTISKLSFNAKS